MSYISPRKGVPLSRTVDTAVPPEYYNSRPPVYEREIPYNTYDYPRRGGERWSEYIPVEQRYTDYIPETKVDYVPIEKSYTDYIEVKHETDYVPVPRLEKRVEYIPVDRYDEHVDYMPVQSSHVVKTPSQYGSYGRDYRPSADYRGAAYYDSYRPYSDSYRPYYGDRYRPYYGFGGYSGYGYRYS